MHLRLADLIADLLVAVVHGYTEASLGQLIDHFLRARDVAVGHRHDTHLLRRKPCRERTGKVLGDNADEALDRAEHHAVDHDRTMLLTVRADILQFKALRQLGVELDRATLPSAAERIGQMEVQLRAIERAVALVDYIVLAHLSDGFLEDILIVLPLLHRTDVILRHGGQFDLVAQAEYRIHLIK